MRCHVQGSALLARARCAIARTERLRDLLVITTDRLKQGAQQALKARVRLLGWRRRRLRRRKAMRLNVVAQRHVIGPSPEQVRIKIC